MLLFIKCVVEHKKLDYVFYGFSLLRLFFSLSFGALLGLH